MKMRKLTMPYVFKPGVSYGSMMPTPKTFRLFRGAPPMIADAPVVTRRTRTLKKAPMDIRLASAVQTLQAWCVLGDNAEARVSIALRILRPDDPYKRFRNMKLSVAIRGFEVGDDWCERRGAAWRSVMKSTGMLVGS